MDEKILRNAIQKTIHEIGVIILYIVLSATISYFFYIIFYSVNKPPIISEILTMKLEIECMERLETLS